MAAMPLADLDHRANEEVAQLKRELARVKKERDFLRSAATYFAKESS